MKKNILLVEYSNPTIETIKELLSHPIFNITLADEGEAAKLLLKNNRFDMMITAAMLPKFHGFNLSQFAATNYPETKIIIISEVYKGMDYKYQATTQYKADDFFEKPLALDKFKDRVLNLLEIKESDLKESQSPSPPKTSVSDTKKIPVFKKMEEEEKTLTSEDIFGDIIDEVQKSTPYEIKLDSENEDHQKSQPKLADKKTGENKDQEKIKPEAFDFTPITLSKTLDQLKNEKKVEKKTDDKFKKLEDDISKKFEQTLSGLGLDAKKHGLKDSKPKPSVDIQEKIKPGVEVEEDKQEELGGYDILGLIARGGMAEIYKAKKKGVKGFEKIIALKKILSGYGKDDKYIEMFVDEAKISAELSHPNIVQIYDLGRKDDYYFIAMEYISGKDLRLILRKLEITESLLPEEISTYLIIKVLEALNYAHSAKNSAGKNLDIVHRDISPPNILVSFDGEVKLTDFGVSKASIKLHQTIAGALKGKLLYMSPEQASGDQNIDFRSDLYSVGIIFFELITGKKLFINPSEMAVLKKVQSGEIVEPSKIKKDINPAIEHIILKLLKKEREERYQKAADVIKDLETYISKQFSHMPGPSHMSHTIFNLFKEEINREGIKIELKPIPYEIKKIKTDVKEERREPEKEEIVDSDIEELKEEDIVVEDIEEKEPIPKPTEEIIAQEQEPVVSEREVGEENVDQDFGTTFEIEFDEDKKEKPDTIPVPKAQQKGATPEPELVEPGIKSIDEEFKKSKKPLIFSLAAIFLIAAFIVAYLLVIGKKPATQDDPESLVQKPAVVAKDIQTKSTPQDKTSSETSKDSMGTALKKGDMEARADDSETMLSKFTPPGRTYLERETSGESEPEKQEENKIEKKQVNVQPVEKKEETQTTSQVKKPQEEEPIPKVEKVAPSKPEEKEDKPVEKEDQTKTAEEKEDQLPDEEQLKQKEMEDQKQKALLLEQEKEAERKRLEAEAKKNRIKEGQTVPLTDVDTPPAPISEPGVVLRGILRNMITQSQNISVNYLIDQNGNVERVFILKKSRFKKLNELVEKTLLSWKYKPAIKDNVKVKVWKTISFKITK